MLRATDLTPRAAFCCGALAVVAGLAAAPAWAAGLPDLTNDYGNIGLLQTPAANLSGEGEFRGGYASVLPYGSIFLSMQPYDWLEATFRYTSINNREYRGSPDGQSYKDRSFDVKLRLWAEGAYRPAVAFGIQDIAGTGLFSSEYLVASKAFGDLSFHTGLAWGRLGSRGEFRNPFAAASDSFETRNRSVGQGGRFDLKNLFSGPRLGVFGGAVWNPGGGPFSFIVERDGNAYQDEAFGNDQPVQAAVNLGAAYVWRSLHLGIGYERGDLLTFRAAFALNLANDRGPAKVLDSPPTPVAPPEAYSSDEEPGDAEAQAAFVENLRGALARQGFVLHAVDYDATGHLSIWFSQQVYLNQATAIGRVARAAANLAPQAYQRFTLIDIDEGVEQYRVSMDRAAIQRAASGQADVEETLAATRFTPPQPQGADNADYPALQEYPEFQWSMGPKLRQSIGGPDGFFFGQLWWRVAGRAQLSKHLDVTSAVGFNIWNNFDQITLESNSVLPHVRSDIVRYLQEGENNLVELEANYIRQIAPNWYGRLSAGIFEEMYGGVAGELLYRPFGKPYAVGANINRVRQRDFDQRLSFRDYEVTTGHLTLYYNYRPLHLLAQISAGRYLAGDYGTTLDFSRRFANGASAGIFATFTDVSSEDFGEGSFDKGFYVSFPLDLFFPRSVKRTTTLAFRPLTRDGGQKVDDGRALYGVTDEGYLGDIADGWDELLR